MDQIIKQDFMAKRSQMKGTFKKEDYKSRWFRLTPTRLYYLDGSIEMGAGKVKGSIALESIIIVEQVDCEPLHNRTNAFQICYTEMTKDRQEQRCTLYIIAVHEQQMLDWIEALREACNEAGCWFSELFHPGVWMHSLKPAKYSCCESINKRFEGCQKVTCAFAKKSVTPSPDHRPSPNFRMESDRPDQPTRRLPPQPEERQPVPAASFGKILAMHDYTATDSQELNLVKGEEYDLLEEFKAENWLTVRNQQGETGHVPATFIRVLTTVDDIEEHEWYYPNLSRIQSDAILQGNGGEGCFLVRPANAKGSYSLSVVVKKKSEREAATVKHYHIKTTPEGLYFLSERHPFETIPQLIYYHKRNAAGLIVRLRFPPDSTDKPAPAVDWGDTLEINPSLLHYAEVLGTGQFGIVKKAIYDNKHQVAVKTMKEGMMSENDFIDEAKIMIGLRHQNLVSLFGVYTASRPLLIVTEFMKHGALLHYLKRHKHVLLADTETLIDMCMQVCSAMEYLEQKKYLHRDLAARNCLVGENNVIKVADFGFARCVMDDEYLSSAGAKFPVKWSAPEVLLYTRFSSKSDVWSFGVFVWEVFTCGETPYNKIKRNPDLVDSVCNRNLRLEQPPRCPDNVYKIQMSCWAKDAEKRPSFSELYSELCEIQERDFTNDSNN